MILSVGGILYVVGGHFTLILSSLGTFTGLISLDYIASTIEWYSMPALFGLSPHEIINVIATTVQHLGILIAAGLFLHGWYVSGRRGERVFGSKLFESRTSVNKPDK
jgi:hypothetical protein